MKYWLMPLNRDDFSSFEFLNTLWFSCNTYQVLFLLQIFLYLSFANSCRAWEIACASGRRVCWGVINWYIVGTVELGMMYKSQKIGGSISRELLVLKEVHLKSTQFERRSNLYNKLLKYLTGILSWEMKILFFLYLIYIWMTNLF